MSDTLTDLTDRKGAMRRAAYDARAAQDDKNGVSQVAIANFLELPEYRTAATALWYLDCRSELRTKQALPAALASGKRIVVPYCTVDENGANKLGLWRLENMEELVVGKWKILEPPHERWGEPGKEIDPAELDPDAAMYDLGVDSIMSTELRARIQESFGVDVPVDDLVGPRTVRQLAEFVRRGAALAESANR